MLRKPSVQIANSLKGQIVEITSFNTSMYIALILLRSAYDDSCKKIDERLYDIQLSQPQMTLYLVTVSEKIEAISCLIRENSQDQKMTIFDDLTTFIVKNFSTVQRFFVMKFIDMLFKRMCEIIFYSEVRRTDNTNQEYAEEQQKATSKYLDIHGDRLLTQSFDILFDKCQMISEGKNEMLDFSSIREIFNSIN